MFITGTDTGVGKTTVAVLLTHFLRRGGRRVGAIKPVCSGGRGDARALHAALGGALTREEVNPWHFAAALAPLLAARRAGDCVRLAQVVAHVRRVHRRFGVVLVEGAGGLLSPLGEGFSSRELLVALRATPLIVCPNRLGAVNQVRLVLAALPPRFARRAIVVLVDPRGADLISRSNRDLLAEYLSPERVIALPRLRPGARVELSLNRARVRKALVALTHAALPRLA